jgi:hypothetical protein
MDHKNSPMSFHGKEAESIISVSLKTQRLTGQQQIAGGSVHEGEAVLPS